MSHLKIGIMDISFDFQMTRMTWIDQKSYESYQNVDQQRHLSHLKIGIRIITFDFQMT